jgi:hypothetical protein
MTAPSSLPTNKNFLSPLGFTFSIKKTPNVNYFVQAVALPSLLLGQSDIRTPFVKLPIPGDQLDFGTLIVTYRVDEEMRNYKEIFDWMIALGFPDNFGQYAAIAPNRGKFGGNVTNPTSGTGPYSDASLIVLNSVKAPIINIIFKNLYPISLTDVLFDTMRTDVDYVDATVTFAFESFTLNYI